MATNKNTPLSDMKEKQPAMQASDKTPGSRPSLLPRSKKHQNILLERAALLAQKRESEEADDKHESYLLFRLGNAGLYGIPWHDLVEVMPKTRLTTVPGAAECILGVFNRRGKILSALNITTLIGLSDNSSDGMDEMIVVTAAGMTVGIAVNELLGSQDYDPARLEPPMLMRKKNGGASYVHGIDKGKITLLNLESLLRDPRLS